MSTRDSKYNLSSGWNLISSYGYNQSLNQIFHDYSDILVEDTLYSYINGYEVVDFNTLLSPGKGYWVKLNQSVNFKPNGTCSTLTVTYSSGWNIISTPFNSNLDLNATDLSSVIIQDTLYEYTNSGYVKPSNLVLEAGKGYWIKLSSEKTITFTVFSLEMSDDNLSGWIFGSYKASLRLYSSNIDYTYSLAYNKANEEVYFTVPDDDYTIYWEPGNSSSINSIFGWTINYINNGTRQVSNLLNTINYNITIDTSDSEPEPEPEPPSGDKMTIYLAFHIILNPSQGTQVSTTMNNNLQEQFNIMQECFSITSESMKPDNDGNFTPGGNPMRFNFVMRHIDNDPDKWYTSVNYNGSPDFNPDYLNGNLIRNNGPALFSNLAIDWNTTLNVYFSDPTSGSGLLGIAKFPSSSAGSPNWGTWCLLSSIPNGGANNFQLGKTLVHEAGHCFGLYHTFQGGGDQCNDTPNDSDADGGSYLLNGERREKDDPVIPDFNTNDPGRDPVYNYMNYCYDNTMLAFTDDQNTRMESQIQQYLPQIWATLDDSNKNTSMKIEHSNRLTSNELDVLYSTEVTIKKNNKLVTMPFMHEHKGRCQCKHPATLDFSQIINFKSENDKEIIKKFINNI